MKKCKTCEMIMDPDEAAAGYDECEHCEKYGSAGWKKDNNYFKNLHGNIPAE